jgi:hypothetical protein
MLHKTTKNKGFAEILNQGFKGEDIVDLILKMSKFESILKSLLQNLVQNKVDIWANDKANCHQYINEIAEYFTGNRNWGKEKEIDENYAGWFRSVADNINSLDFKSSTKTGRKIQ